MSFQVHRQRTNDQHASGCPPASETDSGGRGTTSFGHSVLLGAGLLFALSVFPQQSPTADSSAEQPGRSESVIAYEAEFFAGFNPVSALDMLARLPGFTIDTGDSVRGFAEAVGNVLVDGERPSAKGQSLADILSRIPADNVARIELIRGRIAGVDMRGRSVVANVIRSEKQAGGFAVLRFRWSEDGQITPDGEASATGEIGRFNYTLGLRRSVLQDVDEQLERLLDADRTGREFRRQNARSVPREWTATANFDGRAGDWSLRSNNELFLDDFRFTRVSPAFDAESGALLRTDTTRVDSRTRRIELGGDAERRLSDSASWKFIALQTLTGFNSAQSAIERENGSSFTAVAQGIDESSGESILRTLGSWTPDRGRSYEFGLEGTYNYLDSRVQLSRDEGSGPVAQELPVSDTKVEEYRIEPFANVTWRWDEDFRLEAGLAAEMSTLKQSGDARKERSFVFFKPTIHAVHDLSVRDQLRISFLRDVAQLDFRDFVSSATLEEGTTDLGNPALEPQRDWFLRGSGNGAFRKATVSPSWWSASGWRKSRRLYRSGTVSTHPATSATGRCGAHRSAGRRHSMKSGLRIPYSRAGGSTPNLGSGIRSPVSVASFRTNHRASPSSTTASD